jgi:hypothetical protein
MDENAPYSMSRNLPRRNTAKCTEKFTLKFIFIKHHLQLIEPPKDK